MIYFAQAAPDAPIKVGCSGTPEKRVRGLTRRGERKLGLLLVIPGGKAEESYINRRLFPHMVKSEWFECCGDVLIYIAECRAAGRVLGFSGKGNRLKKDVGPCRVSPERMAQRYSHILASRRDGLTLVEVGARHNITRERVRQIINAAEADDIRGYAAPVHTARKIARICKTTRICANPACGNKFRVLSAAAHTRHCSSKCACVSKPRHITDATWQRALELRAAGATWGRIAIEVFHTKSPRPGVVGLNAMIQWARRTGYDLTWARGRRKT